MKNKINYRKNHLLQRILPLFGVCFYFISSRVLFARSSATAGRNFRTWRPFRRVFVMLCVLVLGATAAVAQEKRITGAVADETGEPLAGATVTIKGLTKGVITDADGHFDISVAPAASLEIAYLGYETLTVPVGSQTFISVRLEPKRNELDEVTVVAFGKQKKSSVVASIQTVNTKDLKIASSNLTTAFAGKIPGLISYQMSGEPGADNAQFFVRGVTTFGYKTSPLILVDGFEATSDDLARMQPDDIESFSILKDASATALYGARGANGIILVSTKSGMEGTVKISARVDVNMATPTRMNELVDGVDYMRLYNEAAATRGMTTGFYDPQKILYTEQGRSDMLYPNIDWYRKLFNRQTYNTKANINLQGGGQVSTYYVAGGFDRETGLLKVDNLNNFNNNIDINRFHIRSNVVFKLSKATTLDTRIQGRFERYNGPYDSASNIFEKVMDANPVDYPAVWRPDAANLYTRNVLFGTAAGAPANAYAQMVRGYENRDETTITAQATLSHDFSRWVEGLKFQLKGSANVWNYYSAKRSYNPYYYALLTSNPNTGDYMLYCTNPENESAMLGDVQASRNSSGHYYFEARLNWDHKFGAHTVGFMTVGMMEEYVLTAGSSSSIFETLPERNLGNSGRFTYDYDERYFLEFAYGYNGSEKFASKHRYGFFPSIGAGWLVSNEAFWDRLKTPIPTAKLKFTYGLVGNDAIAGRSGRFFYLSNITLQSSTSDNTVAWGKAYNNRHGGYGIARYGNDDISWEVSTKLNVGFELGLMKGEPLKIQADWFTDVRDKIYMNRANLPASAGFSAKIDGNIGKVKSQGFDASVDYQHFFSSDFWLTGRGNFTYATNKYLILDEPNYKYGYLSKVGQNINQQWGYVAERLFVDAAEIANSPEHTFGMYQAGDVKYKDVNGDGKVDPDDRIPMGFPTVPEIQYGYGLSAGYRNFDLSFFFQGNARVSFFINSQAIAPFSNHRNALRIVADDYWQETNPDEHAFWPRLSVSPLENNTQQSSWWLRDGKFMRLKTLEAGYTLPDMTKLGIKTCRIYFSGENLFVVSPFKMWDPEMGNNGLAYPINRRFNAGIQVSF